nr:tetratricopeptide repeat protein [Vibrio nigripulchritudo]
MLFNLLSQSDKNDTTYRLLNVLIEQADSAQNQGDYVSSEKVRRQVVTIMTQAGVDPVEIARQLSNLASVLNINNQPQEAESLVLEAMELLEDNPSQDRIQLAVLRGNLGEALRKQGKIDEAQVAFEEELNLLEKENLLDTHFAASAKAGLGAIQAERGNFQEALMYYEQAIPIFLSISNESHPVTSRYIREFEAVKNKVVANES